MATAAKKLPAAKKTPAAKIARAATGFNKALTPSAELATVIGDEAIPTHGSYEENMGIHQGQRPAGLCE